MNRVGRMRKGGLLAVALGLLFLCAGLGIAQGRPGGGGPGGGGPGGGSPGGGGVPGASRSGGAPDGGAGRGDRNGLPMGTASNGGRADIPPPSSPGHGAGSMGPNGALQLGPVGRWWDDKEYSKAISLRPDQKKKMDAIFNANRSDLTSRFQALREEESKLESATRDTHLSQESIFGQMDRVAQARDALEKVNTRLMMSLRKELDPDQASRIQASP